MYNTIFFPITGLIFSFPLFVFLTYDHRIKLSNISNLIKYITIPVDFLLVYFLLLKNLKQQTLFDDQTLNTIVFYIVFKKLLYTFTVISKASDRIKDSKLPIITLKYIFYIMFVNFLCNSLFAYVVLQVETKFELIYAELKFLLCANFNIGYNYTFFKTLSNMSIFIRVCYLYTFVLAVLELDSYDICIIYFVLTLSIVVFTKFMIDFSKLIY